MKKDIRLKGQLRFLHAVADLYADPARSDDHLDLFYEQSGRNHDGNHCDSVWNRSRCALYVQ